MLYLTTVGKNDVHTCAHAMSQDRGADGGLYVPFRLPVLEPDTMKTLLEGSSSSCVCRVLKLLLGVDLKEAELDFQIGRNPVRLFPLAHKIIAMEAWHNPQWDFSGLINSLVRYIRKDSTEADFVSSWMHIAVRISVLFGSFAQLQKLGFGERTVDIAVDEDLCDIISCVYARKMGLPVGNVICSCYTQSSLWELLHTGQISMSKDIHTPDVNMERLIFETLGWEPVQSFRSAMERKIPWTVSDAQRACLRQAVYAVVVSEKRIESVIPNVFRTSSYIFAPDAALAYGGLLDYRSNTSQRRPALVFSDHNPERDLAMVASCMNMDKKALKARLRGK